MEKQSLHKGHRERLMQKFDKNPEVLSDHELLEAILFMMIPRVDTNPIAHKLIRVFGSLSAVFNASPNELCSVSGVGKETALKLHLIGKTYERVAKQKVTKKKINSHSDIIEHVVAEFSNLKKERCKIYLLNSRFGIINSIVYEDNEYGKVEAEPKEVLTAISAVKPKFILIAHNHPSGSLKPSVRDDYTTATFIKLCELLNVDVIDHIIVADDEYYSYSSSGHLDEIKKNPNFYRMIATGTSF